MMNLPHVSSAGPVSSHGAATSDQQRTETAKTFEAVFLSQFVDEMMKTTGDTAFGTAEQAEMWRSFMSDAVSRQLVEQGGLGLAGQVSDMLQAYSQQTSQKKD